MFQLKGRLKEVKETRQVSDKFSVREFVLTDESSQYPQHVQFQATQDRCALLDGFQVGGEVTVNFNIRGREWTSPQGEVKYFNSLDAWRIEAADSVPAPIGSDIPPAATIEGGSDDDLPF
ncbi:MAG: hypothetical protein CMP61_09130 [Flavobacteriales bacterium]|nr:hypothetical protein [Flavobacteriales bacterium]|tara:strand:- start:3595 stop:3954 length:360 start_codon:yes stop_codon:yes gene_type:complete